MPIWIKITNTHTKNSKSAISNNKLKKGCWWDDGNYSVSDWKRGEPVLNLLVIWCVIGNWPRRNSLKHWWDSLVRYSRKNGGGGGNWTRVPSKPISRDYMLISDKIFCCAILSELKSHCLVRMKRSRLITRGLHHQPCLLLRSSTVAGVQWWTSRHLGRES